MPEPNDEIWRASEMFSRKSGTFLTALQRSMANIFVLRHLHTGGQNFLITILIIIALVDANKRFLTVDVGQYGRVSDGNVFSNSNIAMRLARQNIGLPPGPLRNITKRSKTQ